MIGLTGAVGAGKSTLAALFASAGCRVIDVDALGHEALESPEIRTTLVRDLGPAAVRGDGTVDRPAVARAVFADPSRLRRLEEAVHPVVRRRVQTELAAARRARPRAVVVDCALLFEGGLDALCDETVAVDAVPEVRIARLRMARGWTAAEVRDREAAQLPAAEKRARADHVIENDGDEDSLRRSAAELLDVLAPPGDAGETPSGPGGTPQERNDG